MITRRDRILELTPMRFKTFTWPHNPTSYSITFQRVMAVNKVPFGRYYLQDLGLTRRVMKGEGVFTGADAYESFSKLASLFYDGTPGTLVHPVWNTTSAYLVNLQLEQEPRQDYVAYSFEFWETYEGYATEAVPVTATAAASTSQDSGSQAVSYTVCKGDTLWAIAQRYSTTVSAIEALNPSLKNPNLILVGQVLRVR
jgi:LysM repeat protein